MSLTIFGVERRRCALEPRQLIWQVFWRSHTFIERNGIEIRENKHYNRDKYIFGCFTILDEVSFFIMVDLVLVGVH